MILCVIPFAIVGRAPRATWSFGISFALFSWLGVIAAIGVVVNDNVVLVDRCNQIRGYFALRPKRRRQSPCSTRKKAGKPHEITVPNGQVLEYVAIAGGPRAARGDSSLEGLEFGLPRKARSNSVDSSQMKWEKREYRERAEELEGFGFQVMRVRAERGIIEASVSRFRQIFLTSVTEFVGMSPMILENAAIVQFLKPMVLSLAFGVLVCMPATLILTPAFYMIGIDIKRIFDRPVRLLRQPLWRAPKLAAAE